MYVCTVPCIVVLRRSRAFCSTSDLIYVTLEELAVIWMSVAVTFSCTVSRSRKQSMRVSSVATETPSKNTCRFCRTERNDDFFWLSEPVTSGNHKVPSVWMYSRHLLLAWQQPPTRGLCLHGQGRRGHLCCSMDVYSSSHQHSNHQNDLFAHAQNSVMSRSKKCI